MSGPCGSLASVAKSGPGIVWCEKKCLIISGFIVTAWARVAFNGLTLHGTDVSCEEHFDAQSRSQSFLICSAVDC